MTAICQKSLPDAPWMEARTRRMPGVLPLDPAQWLTVDDAYSAQMAERAGILRANRDDVLQSGPEAAPAVAELLETVLNHLSDRPEFTLQGTTCTRPDGETVTIDPAKPFETLCHLVTEDFCILQKQGPEHVLTAALLCFPASWTLAQKFGQPLLAIHAPVASYTDDMAKRVQRLFDAVQPDRPLWRANAMQYRDPTLYQPRTLDQRRDDHDDARYIRSERQCILRLPSSNAVVFSIHTRLVAMGDLTQAQAEGLQANPIHYDAMPPDA
ncbi:MAG: DUF3445 domain-containing protein [Sedimentitalea sp.]